MASDFNEFIMEVGIVLGVPVMHTKQRELHTEGQASTEAQQSGKPQRFW